MKELFSWRYDKGLSLTAKGLFAVIDTYFTKGCEINKAKIMDNCVEGKKAFERAWRELKEKGYLMQYRGKDGTGKFYYQYHLRYMRGE